MKTSTIIKVLALAISFVSGSADASSVSRILVPVSITTPVHGAYGSVWVSDLWIRNDGPDTGIFLTCQLSCPPDPVLFRSGAVKRNEAISIDVAGAPPAAVIRLSPATDAVVAKLYIRDISRQSDTWGTEVPTIPENEFATGTTSLMPVPTDSRFRSNLRIYTLDPAAMVSFRVRAYALPSFDVQYGNLPQPFITQTTISGVAATDVHPGFAQVIDLAGALPALVTSPFVRLEIEPVDPNVRYWAFVSVTNNATQHVTLVTP